jgi:hypothetical protein
MRNFNRLTSSRVAPSAIDSSSQQKNWARATASFKWASFNPAIQKIWSFQWRPSVGYTWGRLPEISTAFLIAFASQMGDNFSTSLHEVYFEIIVEMAHDDL